MQDVTWNHCACNTFCVLSKSILRKESSAEGKIKKRCGGVEKKQKRKKKKKKEKKKRKANEEKMETKYEKRKPVEMEAYSEKNSVLYRCSSCPLTKWSLSC